MTSTHVPPITEEDIANFLTNTPGFFERHAEVLASVQITSPHGQRAVSLQERQAEMLREKIKGLEHRIMDMVRNSNDNTAIATKVHQWTSALLRVKDPFDLPEAVVSGIRTLFDVPQAAVRVWTVAGPYIDADFTQGASEDARAFASSLTCRFAAPTWALSLRAGWHRRQASPPSRWLCCPCAKAPSTAPRQRLACWCWALPTRSALTPPWARNSSRALRSWPARRWCG